MTTRESCKQLLNCRQQALAQFDRSGSKQAAKAVINRLLKILLAAKISLSSEHGCLSQQKLDLFNLAAVYVAELRACSAKIIRSEMIELHPFRTSRTKYHMTFSEIALPHGVP